jgi:hypothetical protein
MPNVEFDDYELPRDPRGYDAAETQNGQKSRTLNSVPLDGHDALLVLIAIFVSARPPDGDLPIVSVVPYHDWSFQLVSAQIKPATGTRIMIWEIIGIYRVDSGAYRCDLP